MGKKKASGVVEGDPLQKRESSIRWVIGPADRRKTLAKNHPSVRKADTVGLLKLLGKKKTTGAGRGRIRDG